MLRYTDIACLVTVSEKVYREYEVIKSKHDVQSRVMEDTMKSASQVICSSFFREIDRSDACEMSKWLINEGGGGRHHSFVRRGSRVQLCSLSYTGSDR